jgi:adenylate cyclase class IV
MADDAGGQGQFAASRRNVELKATDPFPERSLAVCRELGAEDGGALHQRDTYFWVSRGRLKVREEADRAWLIPYHRSDAGEARASRYRLIHTPDPHTLRQDLEATLGKRAVVEKERRLFLWRGLRIHLDWVAGLGAFLELEAVVEPGSDLAVERARVEAPPDSLSDQLRPARRR